MKRFFVGLIVGLCFTTLAAAQTVPGNQTVAPNLVNSIIKGTRSVTIPHGPTTARATDPRNGELRVNDNTGLLEWYSTLLGWQTASGGGGGGGGEQMPTASFNTAGTAGFGFNFCDATGASYVMTMPTAVGNIGKIVEIKKTDATVHTVTPTGQLGQTIDGSPSFVITDPNQTVSLISDGSNWKIK